MPKSNVRELLANVLAYTTVTFPDATGAKARPAKWNFRVIDGDNVEGVGPWVGPPK
jgi:hypothetical protein